MIVPTATSWLDATGAQYVIANLWQANQWAAAILMGHYFRFRLLREGKHSVIGGLNEAQRLTMRMPRDEVMEWLSRFLPDKAQLWGPLIGGMEDLPFAHPYDWASFYVTEDD